MKERRIFPISEGELMKAKGALRRNPVLIKPATSETPNTTQEDDDDKFSEVSDS
jgi:hypothetical protein